MAGIQKLPTLVHLFKPHAAFTTIFICAFQNRKISSNSLKMAQAADNPNHTSEIQEPLAKIQKIHDQNGVSEAAIAPFLRVKRLSEKAVLPSRGSPLSAGYDLSRYAFLSP